MRVLVMDSVWLARRQSCCGFTPVCQYAAHQRLPDQHPEHELPSGPPGKRLHFLFSSSPSSGLVLPSPGSCQYYDSESEPAVRFEPAALPRPGCGAAALRQGALLIFSLCYATTPQVFAYFLGFSTAALLQSVQNRSLFTVSEVSALPSYSQ